MSIEELSKDREFHNFHRAIEQESDPTMLTLRAHLYTENLLERIILAKLSRGDKAVENGNFTYYQKLVLTESLESLPDNIVSSLRGLNKLRNQCAHELEKKISMGDIVKIGSPLGKIFSKMKREANFEENEVFRRLLHYVVGFLAGACFTSEHR